MFSGVSFETLWRILRPQSFSTEPLIAFVSFIERKTGARLYFDEAKLPFEDHTIADLMELAQRMHHTGVLQVVTPALRLPDEPPTFGWHARYRAGTEGTAGATDMFDDRLALIKSLAEVQERFIWSCTNDYFAQPLISSLREMRKPHVHPLDFAGIPASLRSKKAHLSIDEHSEFLWIRGYDWTKKGSVWIPAQIISVHEDVHTRRTQKREPFIRSCITTGLATHPQRTLALISGALEVFERDAYMITWLNQISPGRYDIAELARNHPPLASCISKVEQYRLRIHALQLLTDAPTHVVGVVLEDTSDIGPRFTLGLCAHQKIEEAILKATLEALRARVNTRTRHSEATDKSAVGHHERLAYWADPARAHKLTFLLEGPRITAERQPFEDEEPEAYFARIQQWCADNQYPLISVALTPSKANVTGWHTEMVVIPQMQPIYFSETLPHCAGERLARVPKALGYPVREPYLEEPHPFV